MHGLRRSLLQQQAQSIGLPLRMVEMPQQATMDEYNRVMSQAMSKLTEEGYTHCAFGDIFLEDLRAYREKELQAFDIVPQFPLWKCNTRELIEEFLSLGFRAVVLCANAQLLDESFVGREIDERFLDDLPASVDPCGENGEFHTFCFDGPIFSHPIEFSQGEKVLRTYPSPSGKEGESVGFWFLDLLPVGGEE